jgi:hypothetical protein
MNKKIFFSVMLLLTLALGMAVVGCDDGSTNGGDNNQQSTDASGVNAVSGKTYFEWSERIVFSTTAEGAANGTYTVGSTVYDKESGEYVLADGKYTYEDQETGSYTWNETAKTVILQPQRVAFDSAPLDQAAYRSAVQAMINDYITEMGQDAVNQQLSSMGFSSTAAYIDYEVNGAFANRTNNYSFSADGAALFLEKPLPANVGANELSGQTYYGMSWDDVQGKEVKDTSLVYVFTASGYTFNDQRSGETQTTTGSYAYDGNQKRVWLRPSLINGKDRAAYYEAQAGESGHNFVNDNAYRASQTNGAFDIWEQDYNSTNKTIGWEEED